MRAIVIGGGIAGATAALALRHIGADVTVYEAYEDPAGDIGSFISLASNGLRSLDALGCLARVQDAGVDIPRQRMWSAGGHLLGDVPRGRRSSETLHSVTLIRGRLVAILRQAAADAGGRVVAGRRLVGVTETPEGVTAEFAGGERDNADLLVAADGIWSTVRRLLDAAAPRPEYAGLYAVSGVSTMDGVESGVFNMTFARNGAFIHLAAGDRDVWWQAQIADPVQPDRTRISETHPTSRYPGSRSRPRSCCPHTHDHQGGCNHSPAPPTVPTLVRQLMAAAVPGHPSTNRTFNAVLRSMRCLGERGFAILTGRCRTLRHTTARPCRVGDIVAAALHLTLFEYKYLPQSR